MLRLRFVIVPFVLALQLGCAGRSVNKDSEFASCKDDPARAKKRSVELQAILKEDQDTRKDFFRFSPEDLKRMSQHDLILRKRVAEIWAEGCFTQADDYAAGALVMQHGDSPDHYFQTYLWAKRAVELGDSSKKRLMALGIDRYLVNTGRKQLFGSQARKESGSQCWCLQPIEKRFPDSRRIELAGQSLKEAIAWVNELNQGTDCGIAKECEEKLAPTPDGAVPGVW